ncbi:S41 family peptidase [Staphylococcus auricularis]|uniref:S41 family peptidase n=1 Tax=Staphylococcus auricularis TaxID=29379 RepID=UPI003EB7F2DE
MTQTEHQQDESNQDQNENKNKSGIHTFKTSQLWLSALVIILITVMLTVAATLFISHKLTGLDANQRDDISKIENVYKTLSDDYYKGTTSNQLTESAINGMVKSLKDPYSEYMTKDETESFNEDVSGDFVGIGAEMQKKDDQIQITSPMKGSPAEKAGIQPKDVVEKVNGKSVKGKPLESIVKEVRGKKGTNVTLTVKRGSDAHDIKIKRDKIHVKSVDYETKSDIAILTINKFQNSTAAELKSAVLKAHKAGKKDLVLDLRNNPGGLLDEAVKMANIFIDKDKTVVKLQKGKQTEEIPAPNDKVKETKDMNVSILINEGSASASEVFTGALKDYGIAKVYGSKSFGKGIVQTTKEFDDGSLLKFTNMKWLTPEGHYIHGKGIKPDVKIDPPAYQSLNVIPSDQTFKQGDQSKHIKTMKVGLKALDYQIDNQSTQYDAELVAAVKDFQQQHDLDVTGEFNKKTNETFTQQLVEKANDDDVVLDKMLERLK